MLQSLREIPKTVWLSIFLFLGFAVLNLYLRPLLPNAETRYITVAWNMWLSENHLVPFMDGQPYSAKPPLLFTIIEEAWDYFGPSEAIARMVPAIMTSASFLLTFFIARALWPEETEVARLSPLVLLSFIVFILFAHTLMFDGTLTVCVLLGILGVIYAARGQALAGFIILATATTLGLFIKGPVFFVPVGALGLLYPLWRPSLEQAVTPGRWYAIFLGAIILGSLAPLAWAYLAFSNAGQGYGFDLLWTQTAGRVVQAFAHQKPWWYYLAYSPAILFPWFFWTELNKKSAWTQLFGDWQGRLLLTWSVASFIIFSAISGKRVLYLLPIMPAFALIVSRMLCSDEIGQPGRFLAWIPVFVIGLAVSLAATFSDQLEIPLYVTQGVSIWLGPAFIAIAIFYFYAAQQKRIQKTALAVIGTLMILISTEIGAGGILQRFNSIKLLSQIPHADTVALAVFDRHHGEFGYSAQRLEKVTSLFSLSEVQDWTRKNPQGYVLAPMPKARKYSFPKPQSKSPFKDAEWGVWRSAMLNGKHLRERD